MMYRTPVFSSIALLFVYVFAAPVSASMIASLHTAATFPSAAEFQTFDPSHIGPERTLKQTRYLTQTFQLSSAVNVGEIDLMYARGMGGTTGRVQIFNVADTLAANVQSDFDDAVANGFLLDDTFLMPVGHTDNGNRALKLVLSSAVNLPATTSPAGYGLALSVPDGTSEVLTWKFGEGPNNNADSWYVDGRMSYDDFNAGGTEFKRDGLFALNGNITGGDIPEPTSLSLLVIGLGVILMRRRA